MGSWGGFGASWGGLGTVSKRFSGGLGASWNDFEASRRDLGTYWDDLGAVLAAVGGISKIIDFPLVFNDFLKSRGVLGVSWGALGGLLGVLGSSSGALGMLLGGL